MPTWIAAQHDRRDPPDPGTALPSIDRTQSTVDTIPHLPHTAPWRSRRHVARCGDPSPASTQPCTAAGCKARPPSCSDVCRLRVAAMRAGSRRWGCLPRRWPRYAFDARLYAAAASVQDVNCNSSSVLRLASLQKPSHLRCNLTGPSSGTAGRQRARPVYLHLRQPDRTSGALRQQQRRWLLRGRVRRRPGAAGHLLGCTLPLAP